MLNLSFELTNSLDATDDMFTQMPMRVPPSPSPIQVEDSQPSMVYTSACLFSDNYIQLSLIRMLRRGNRDETLRAVTQLMSMCNACWSLENGQNIGDITGRIIICSLAVYFSE